MTIRILQGDVREKLKELPDDSVQMCLTSPPYLGLRDYQVEGQIGLEASPEEYIEQLVAVFREVRRVLHDHGTLWVNIGDTYASDGGPGWQGKTGERANRRFTGTRNSVGMREQSRTVFRGFKPKDLVGIPWRLAFALQADGWVLRQDIVWAKANPMPESVRDRCTKAHEYVFLFAKSNNTLLWRHRDQKVWLNQEPHPHYVWKDPETGKVTGVDPGDPSWRRTNLWRGHDYYFEADAIAEEATFGAPNSPQSIKSPHGQGFTRRARAAGNKSHKYVDAYEESETEEHRTKAGLMQVADRVWEKRNKRSVWSIATTPFSDAHFATMPIELAETCIKAGCPAKGVVLDPFFGAGTTGVAAQRLNRDCIGIELNPEYVEMAKRRIRKEAPLLADIA